MFKKTSCRWAALLVLCFPLSSVYGQGFVLKYRIDGVADNFNLGYSVAGAGDVNGDGYSDFIIGAPGRGIGSGLVLVYSGRTGTFLHVLYGNTGERFGWSVAGSGYVNQEGTTDFVVGAPFAGTGGLPSAGSVYLYSGASGNLIRRINGTAAGDHVGWSVAGAGDVNSDGWADIVVGAPGIPGYSLGRAFVYSGKTGVALFQKTGDDRVCPDFSWVCYTDRLGFAVAHSDDVNDDGRPDFIIGVPFADTNGVESDFVDVGSAIVFSGATGDTLFRINGNEGDRLGYSVAGTGDVNSDGRADFIVSAPGADPAGLSSAGSVFVYSGARGNLLYRVNGTARGENFGLSVAGTGDVNGDGVPDFVIGAPLADPNGLIDAGSAYLYSGRDGSLLFQIDGTAAGDQLGQSVAGAGDLDGDGRAEFIVGAPFADPGGLTAAGTAYVFSFPCVARGDVDLSGVTTIEDAVTLLRYVVLGEALPNPTVADVNCDGAWDIVDLVLLVRYLVFGNPTPCCL